MTQLKKNIAANIIGQGWAALLQLAFVPLYLKFLGIESYGLIGFYTVMQAILQILDLGMSPTMTRELARLSSLDGKGKEMRDFVRTLEIVYWSIGIVIFAVIACSSSFIAHHWIKESSLPIVTVSNAILLMGIVSFFQWPVSFYQGGLMGLQRLVQFNSIKVIMSTFSTVGAVLVLWLISPTIMAFLKWQVFSNSLQILILATMLWHVLPERNHKPQVRRSLLKNIASFAAGMSGLSITAIVLTQTDKIMLSKLLTLENFGYYVLASAVAGGLGMITGPLFNALFPQFTALVTVDNQDRLRRLYHRGTQTMSVLLIPPATVIAFFAFDVILAWTGNVETARNTSAILRLLVIGTALNGLMSLPYILQLAYGWTSLGLRINIFFIATMIPLLFGATAYFGSEGAAAVWLILNIIYLIVGVPLTHRRLLKGEARRWYTEDVGWPVLAAVAVTILSKLTYPQSLSRMSTIFELLIILFAVAAVTALSAKEVRQWAFSRF
jgi:O-antigen/teichoic acid export membrane protein